MKKNAQIRVLAVPEDLAELRGVFDYLRKNGVRISGRKGSLRKKDIVLAVLSERFYRDAELKAQLFDLLAAGVKNILPLNLEDTPVPDEIMNLLFARNIIMSSGKSDEQVAERILSAIPEKKNPMTKILAAAVVVLLVLAGLFLWRSLGPADPAMAEKEPIPNPLGITEEELAEIKDVVIIGDQFAYFTYEDYSKTGHWPNVEDFAYEVREADGSRWYSKEDGRAFAMTRYDDLRFLERMPNLLMLHMVLADVDPDMLPDLSGAAYLTSVSIRSCSISDVEWLAGSPIHSLDVSGTDIGDYGPLSGCSQLNTVSIDGQGKFNADVSGFAPHALRDLQLSGMQINDLSALSACRDMKYLRLDGLQIQDLDFLKEAYSLNRLELNDLPQLQDISGISGVKYLTELRMWQCDRIRDYMPINSCRNLEWLHIDRWNWIPVDSAFLNGLSKLHDIGLFGLNLNNMDFLAGVNQTYGLSLGFCGDIQDYSGLSLVDHYQWIHVNPRSNGGRYGDFSLVQPHLQNASIAEMELYNCTNLDLAALPDVTSRLVITGGKLKDLTGLNSRYLRHLELRDMQYLQSLKGLDGLEKLSNDNMELTILGCVRLTDYSVLDGVTLYGLNLGGMYHLPDFSRFTLTSLRLESIADMENLSCLETLDKDRMYRFAFPGMDDLKDLSVLRTFKGNNLYVPPQVADQAEELVDDGNFHYYEVCYPESGWSPLNEEVVLLSMEELETLPKAVLRRVSRVWIAGDEIIDPNRYELREEWVRDHHVPILYDRESGKSREISTGSITDFSLLSDLTNLWELRLYVQPITNLEGIQNLSSLSQFEAWFCPDLKDVSALYALQNIEEVSLQNTGVDTIQGVQNLPKLRHLNVFNTDVTDLSPLKDCDFSFAEQVGGFVLIAGSTDVEDLSPLAAIPAFQHLNMCEYPAESWMPYVEQAPVKGFVGRMGNDETLRLMVQQHPELEEVNIEDGYHLTDLTPLLELENLHYVHVWDNAKKAGSSLKGHDYQFQLEID